MRKKYRVTAMLTAAVLAAAMSGMPLCAQEADVEEPLCITVLGDSIAKGYSADKNEEITCYGEIVTEEMAAETGMEYEYHNYAKNGLDTTGLNGKILTQDVVLENLAEADAVFLTMGSNDLLNAFKTTAQEILNSDTSFRSADEALKEVEEGVKKNPLIIFKIIDALSNWDYDAFEGEWVKAMDTLHQTMNEDAQLIVTNIYNPLKNMALPGSMNKVVETIIQNMNEIIEQRSEEYGYQIADLFESKVTAHVQKDGLHPDQDGQKLIAGLVKAKVQGKALQEEAVDGPAIKGEEMKEEADSKTEKEESSITAWAWAAIAAAVTGTAVVCIRRKRKSRL